ncbi:hypothetical protein PAHAL_2G235900 [Panicum hallii]|uniref:Uncharacterized protein n=1 Tax=Panicum hallii TaxID=206008 RepID=A0A2T8KQ65_9POAL|nr:hypothetical protein PAHAL_2G235900 [Panicum hallii]
MAREPGHQLQQLLLLGSIQLKVRYLIVLPFLLHAPLTTSRTAPHCSSDPTPLSLSCAARVLRPIAAKLGMTHWDWAAGPCGPAGGVDCQCSNYYSNQTVICHVVRMYVIKRGFSKLADDPIQGCAVMPVVQWVTQQIALIVFAESSRAATSPASFRPTAPTSHICNISVTPSVSRCLLNLTTPKQQIRASNLR